MVIVIFIIYDGDVRPFGVKLLDFGHVDSGVTERYKFEFGFTLRTMRRVKFDVNLLARRATSAQVAVYQKVRFDFIDKKFFIDANKFFAHECRLYQALSVFSKKSFLLFWETPKRRGKGG